MSFRKRNVGISDATKPDETIRKISESPIISTPGVRPSPVDGRRVTSSGSANLDALFAGNGGIPLGTSILIEETGTTDYAGSLLRFYAAEGLTQGHHVHVIGLPESWSRELPGLASESSRKASNTSSDSMKIAWRYEKLANERVDRTGRDESGVKQNASDLSKKPIFCHSFDLSKRLAHPSDAVIKHYRLDGNPAKSCFTSVFDQLSRALASSPPAVIHRILIPSLLSPALYPYHGSNPEHVLAFQHNLRSLLSSYPTRLTIMQTLPLSLYPRSGGLTKWIEILCDGVIALTPFPHSSDAEFANQRDPTTKEEPPQGLLSIHKSPILHETGSGILPSDTDWTFSLSRRKLAIKPFNLPPIEGDTDAQQAANEESTAKKSDLEF